ncbi:MAG: PHP domain-containing protein [Tepidanaerobacter acetatoxydans]|uniref:PHP domain-containing protein n=1 Tax=Tepidanaerobacter TaxID=499228 RepID=UPI000A44653F|nr:MULTISPECIES: PHP domain-containing protein [Tepidanaerobacter]NLU10247.1 PHP domain-containing protein [Tepidanaerobacter acetatoxydans]
MKFDFHIHSVYSDGSSPLEEIFNTGKQLKVSALAITDHDTVLGLKEADRLSKKYAIPFIPGIEFTAMENEKKFHILGYGIDYNSLELIEYSKRLLEYLNAKSMKQIRLMQKNGIDIKEEEFFKEGQGGPLYRAKMLKTLSNHGYLKQEEIMTSLKKYFGDGAPYYVEETFEYYNFQQVCKIIKASKGIAVLAHPNKLKNKDEKLYWDILNSNLLDGVEIYHPANDENTQNELKKIAFDKKLIITGGSDYHGHYSKNKIPICGIDIPDQIYNNLYQYLTNVVI